MGGASPSPPPFRSLELHRLAQLYQRDVGGFLEDRFEETIPVTAMFRAHPELRGSPAAMQSLRRCGELHRELVNLHEVLGLHRRLSTIPEYSLATPGSKWDAVQQGRAAADRERRRLDLGIAPLPDVTDLLGAQGISTALVDMADDISGLTLIGADGNILVAANRGHHILRRRFSFAHEYAHILLDRGRRAVLSRSEDRSSATEVRANAFAAAFLMPADGVRSYMDALSKGLPSRPRADTFDGEAATRVEGRVTARTQVWRVVRGGRAVGCGQPRIESRRGRRESRLRRPRRLLGTPAGDCWGWRERGRDLA